MEENDDSEMEYLDFNWDEFGERMAQYNIKLGGKAQKSIPNMGGFIYLWNLLRRSNFYASTLLSVINSKQKKKLLKRRLQSLKRVQNTRNESKIEGQDLKSDVQAVLNFVIDSVELKLSDDFNQSFTSNDLEDEVESSDDNDFCKSDTESTTETVISISQSPKLFKPVNPVFSDTDLNKTSGCEHKMMNKDSDDEKSIKETLEKKKIEELQILPVDKKDEDEYLSTLLQRRGPERKKNIEEKTGIKNALFNIKVEDIKTELCVGTSGLEKQTQKSSCQSSKIKQDNLSDFTFANVKNNILIPQSELSHIVELHKPNKPDTFLPLDTKQKNAQEVKRPSGCAMSKGAYNNLDKKKNNKKKVISKLPTKKLLNEERKVAPKMNSKLNLSSLDEGCVGTQKSTLNESNYTSISTLQQQLVKTIKVNNSKKLGVAGFKEIKQPAEEKSSLANKQDNAKKNKVKCPICGKMIGMSAINKHLDICTGHSVKKQSLRNSFPSDNELVSLPLNRERKRPRLNPTRPAIHSHGIESIKSALERTLHSSNAVKSYVTEQAEKVAESLPKLKNSGSSGIIAMPVRKTNVSRTPRIAFKRMLSRTPDLSESDADGEEEDVDVVVPSAPIRKSFRSSRSKITYKEIDSDSSDEDQKKISKKLKKINSKKLKRSKNNDDEFTLLFFALYVDEFNPDNDDNNDSDDQVSEHESGDEIKINKKVDIDDKEEGEVDENDVDVEELTKRKFYKYDPNICDASMVNNKFYETEEFHPDQPKLLTGGRLREYQVTGYEWLKILFENGESGILADEMGLGKTIQSISMICKLVSSGVSGPFLICAPMSTIKNWFEEFKRFAPTITVLLLHGTSPERVHLAACLTKEVKNKTQIVVITSYEILRRDLKVLQTYNWAYMVLDEGHRIKNRNSKTLKSLKTLSIQSKLMLTGTPLQNNVMELWSLLNFLLPQMFDNLEAFESCFDMESLQNDERILSMLHQVLTPFLLRRVKSDVDLKIPQKREILVKAPLAQYQGKLYRATVDRSIRKLLESRKYYDEAPGIADPDRVAANSQEDVDEDYLNAPRCTRSKVTVLNKSTTASNLGDENQFVINITLNNMMMQLRKCCNHPYLIQYPISPSNDRLQEIVISCGKMMLLNRMLPPLKQRNHRVLLFSQMTSMLDILEEYCVLKKFEFVRFDGTTKSEERYEYIEEFNKNPDIFIFLLSTRAGGLGINLTGADTVIIYDSDWNPQNDMQAQDRCHRIGQEKPVLVYRLVTMATIDQQIVERATMKRKLEKMIMHQGKFKGHLEKELRCKPISPEELLVLLQAKNMGSEEVQDRNNVISDKELEILLDRSNMITDQSWVESEQN